MRIYIVDDDFAIQGIIRSLVQFQSDIEITGSSSIGIDAMTDIPRIQPDVVFMDVQLPDINGLVAMRTLLKGGDKGKYIILTQFDKEEYVRQAVESGASGYVLKETLQREGILALRSVAAGKQYFSPVLLTPIIERMVAARSTAPASPPLTRREREILPLMLEGRSTDQIAARLSLSERAVEFHEANILQRFGVRKADELAASPVQVGRSNPKSIS